MTDQVAVIQLEDGSEIRLTAREGELIKFALVEWLTKSSYPDREMLLKFTQKASVVIDPDGVLRIGAWVLGAGSSGPVVRYREPPTALGIKAHVATLDRDPWKVRTITTEKILPRR